LKFEGTKNSNSSENCSRKKIARVSSGVARRKGKWGHAPWGATVHFLQSF